jgi:F0F1-type ATP synthase membrane subunit b/b'
MNQTEPTPETDASLPESAEPKVSEEKPAGEKPVEAPQQETGQKPQEKEKKGVLYFLFSPETKVGRVLRPLVRWLGWAVGFFALGVLAAYLTLYQPAVKSLTQNQAALSADLEEANQQLADTKQELSDAQASLDGCTNDTQAMISDRDQALARAALVEVLMDVTNARMALENKDNARARTELMETQQDLDRLSESIKPLGKSSELTSLMEDRLNLVLKELSRDSQNAQTDLEALYNTLLQLNKVLFGE